MDHSAFSTKWLFPHSSWKERCSLSELILPIKAPYQSECALYNLAKAMALGEEFELPQYIPFSFKKRLSQNAKIIFYACHDKDVAVYNNSTITQATQWLIENYYTIEQSIRQVERSLSKEFLNQLSLCPVLKDIPAIFALAWLYIAHTDSSFSIETLTAIVRGYQEVMPFQIGELLALPLAVRFILIENVRRISTTIKYSSLMRQFANKIVLIKDEKDLEHFLSSYACFINDSTFLSYLLGCLRDISFDSALMAWLEKRLVKAGGNPKHDHQTSNNTTMGNIICSLKAIDDVDWTLWFENVCQVDIFLKNNSDFARIDHHSRSAYRIVIEKIARSSPLTELDVAKQAIKLTAFNNKKSVSHYLIGEGRLQLEEICLYRRRLSEFLMQRYKAMRIWSIAAPVFLLTITIIAAVYSLLRNIDVAHGMLLSFSLLTFLPAMDMGFSFFNTLISWSVEPKRLIGFEYKNGIPDEARTLIAVPTVITSQEVINEQIRNLEIHYLNNSRGAISLALVTDWADAPSETIDSDLELLDHAQKSIAVLNRYYCLDSRSQPIFFLLHRKRLYNKAESCWMGWERKRGKLHELNLLLRGKQNTSFLPHDSHLPSNIRFVMTLDSDTRLTPNSITKLVGKLNHPLNQPEFSPKTHSVIRGYGILQPRVTLSLGIGSDTSLLQRIFSVNRGIDPYVFAVSDTYQDLLGEGTFIGKGLYDIDAFERALEGRINENTVLSHDMLEGGYARTAFASDVEVIENYPTAYHVDAARHHRWVRGDWQLLPYLFGKHRINQVTRWKLLDNLRRTLTPLSWIVASVAGWCLLPLAAAIIWQVFLLVGMHIAPILSIVHNIMSINRDYLIRCHFQSILTDFINTLTDILFRTTFLAHTAWYMTDAIIRTSYRMGISHHNLLEWHISSSVQSLPKTLFYYVRMMWPASFIGIIAFTLPVLLNCQVTLLALPFSLLWSFSPYIAWLVSCSTEKRNVLKCYMSDADNLRQIARRTWHFYETFVTAENNHLPPDNFQEQPTSIISKRTSPTNIGVYLLSIVAARDFGWISLNEAIRRISKTLATIELMKKHRGHLYNWYATDTLKPLTPLYVSTVDSGNLAGHLVTLCSALKEWAKIPEGALQNDFSGLLDVNYILSECLDDIVNDKPALYPLRKHITEKIITFRQDISAIYESENELLHIESLMLSASGIRKLIDKLDKKLNTDASRLAVEWAHHLVSTCESCLHDIANKHEKDSLSKYLTQLSKQARQYAFSMTFDFLEQKDRGLFSIGYRVQENELDKSCYDLLASEARLASFFAIAKGDIKPEHWFRLGRMLVPVHRKGTLLSWSGSMFEYLMPLLVMHEPHGSLLGQSNWLAVRQQIAYANKHRLPWGISEAAFNTRDSMMNYQYSSFGVPSLGLQRGLSRNMVIAPYASMLAAQYMPGKAVINLKRLRQLGALGRYGYYDALDFTQTRVREGDNCSVIRNYYAHHHGMSILAINNVFFDGRMRRRFHRDPVIGAVEILLQEKAPREIPIMNSKIENPIFSDTSHPKEIPFSKLPFKETRSTLILPGKSSCIALVENDFASIYWRNLTIRCSQPDAFKDLQRTFLLLRDIAENAEALTMKDADIIHPLFFRRLTKIEVAKKGANFAQSHWETLQKLNICAVHFFIRSSSTIQAKTDHYILISYDHLEQFTTFSLRTRSISSHEGPIPGDSPPYDAYIYSGKSCICFLDNRILLPE